MDRRSPRPGAGHSLRMLGLAGRLAAGARPSNVDEQLRPVREAHQALRTGVATELQRALLASAINAALAIEGQGVVRGLRGHFASAATALSEIRRRAMVDGFWRAPALYYQELDDVAEAIRLRRYQLEQLSAAGVLAKRGAAGWAQRQGLSA